MDDLRSDLRTLVRQLLEEHEPSAREPVAELIRAHLGGEPGTSPIFTEEMEGWELPARTRRSGSSAWAAVRDISAT
jgi:hypothetical protein